MLSRMTLCPANKNGDKSATPDPRRRYFILSGCFVLLGVLGWLDDITGYEMSFFVFYSVPVGLAAWYVGRWAGIMVALAATVTWLLADFYSGAKYSAPFFYYWNSTIHFLAFMINAVTIAKIKSDLDRRYALEAELDRKSGNIACGSGSAAGLPRLRQTARPRDNRTRGEGPSHPLQRPGTGTRSLCRLPFPSLLDKALPCNSRNVKETRA